jgi:Putative DNA-binding domain
MASGAAAPGVIPSSIQDLERLVEERLEENTRLEYKRQLPESGKNDDIAKDIAAMANTDGGVIIYGMDEDDVGTAKALTPTNLAGAAERIGLVAQTLDEPLTLTGVRSVAKDTSGELGYLIVEVPASERAPHLYKGHTLGRGPKSNVPLRRRQVGELFARQQGFAEEFGLSVSRPGRAIARIVREQYQEKLETRVRRFLEIANDGDNDIFHVRWAWLVEDVEGEIVMPFTIDDQFPLDILQHGVSVPMNVSVTFGTTQGLKVQTSWRDAAGKEYAQAWPAAM